MPSAPVWISLRAKNWLWTSRKWLIQKQTPIFKKGKREGKVSWEWRMNWTNPDLRTGVQWRTCAGMQLNRPRSTLLSLPAPPAPSFSSQFSTMRFSYHLNTPPHGSRSATCRTGECAAGFVYLFKGTYCKCMCFKMFVSFQILPQLRLHVVLLSNELKLN